MGLKLFFTLTVISAFISCSLAFVTKKTAAPADGSNWMSANINAFGGRTLKQLCIPGSHDAGMSVFTKGTALAYPCNTLTQSVPIREQLKFGARYFDVRPVLDKGVFYTGHYSKIGLSYQGANGQSIKSIMTDINQFIMAHNEFVMVRLAKSLNYDEGRKFDKKDWENLFKILDSTKNLFVTNDKNVYLPDKTLNELTNRGRKGAVVYIINEDGVDLGTRLGKGFLYFSSLDLHGKYSDTNDVTKMTKKQIQKLKSEAKGHYFLLAWTLTQGVTDAGLCASKAKDSILQLSQKAKGRLWDIVSEVNANAFPNILYIDNIVDNSVIDVVMEINNRVYN